MTSIPTWLLPLTQRLQEYAKESPAIVNHGVFDVIEELSQGDDITIGINYGFGKFHDVSFYINRELFGSECAVVCWKQKGENEPDDSPHGKAFFEAPTAIGEMAQLIWNRYTRLNRMKVIRRFSVVN